MRHPHQGPRISGPFSVYLDCVGIVAALLVVLAHFEVQRLLPAPLWIDDLGHEAVIVFFVLSGIVIRSTQPGSGASFALARATRLYSVVLPALLVSYVCAFLLFVVEEKGSWLEFFESNGGRSVLAMSLAFLNESWFFWNDVPANGPYWSLCYEAWHYALFGFWTYMPAGRQRVLVCGIAALIAGPRILILMPISWAGAWFAGRQERLRSSSTGIGLSLMALGVGGVLAADQLGLAGRLREVTHGIVPQLWVLRHSELFVSDYLIGSFVLLNFAGFKLAERGIGQWVENLKAPVRWMAGSTFSIYLFHYPLILSVALVVKPAESWATTAMLYIVVVLGCVGLSFVSERRKAAFARLWGPVASRLRLQARSAQPLPCDKVQP